MRNNWMQNNWIKKSIEQLKKLYERCNEEKAISSYIVCMIRLLNGLAQIQGTPLHRYERTILYKPIAVFTEYFMARIQETFEEQNAGEKIKDILDVEDAICKLSDIYENVVNGTANADKQMFMALPVNSSVYKLSPKLYALYSNITDCLVDIYNIDDNNSKYAFLLNPTLKSTLQTELLFKRRRKSGKVVIIYIPVRMLEELDSVPMYLTHEVFHVLTKEQRHRKERAYILMLNMINQIGYRLFDNVEFPEGGENDDICTELLDIWTEAAFSDFLTKYESLPDERFFYASEIKEYLAGILNRTLENIEDRLETDILENIAEKYYEQGQSFEKFGKITGDLMVQIETIRKNLYQIEYYNTIWYLLDRLLFLFRETYADVACLLTCEYNFSTYIAAFPKSLQFQIDSEQMELDDYHKIRQKLVEGVMQKEIDQTEEGLLIGEKKDDGICRQSSDRYVIIDKYLINTYTHYLNLCKRSLQESLSYCDQGKLCELRERIRRFSNINEDDSDTISEILIGKESYGV